MCQDTGLSREEMDVPCTEVKGMLGGMLYNASVSPVIWQHCLLSGTLGTGCLYLVVPTSETGPSAQRRLNLRLSTAFSWVEMLPGVHMGSERPFSP